MLLSFFPSAFMAASVMTGCLLLMLVCLRERGIIPSLQFQSEADKREERRHFEGLCSTETCPARKEKQGCSVISSVIFLFFFFFCQSVTKKVPVYTFPHKWENEELSHLISFQTEK